MENHPVDPQKEQVTTPSWGVPEKKKKRRYSSNAKPVQQFERRISKSAHRISKAVEKGIQTYLDKRDRSLENRRDGALIESYVNIASGISKGIEDASPSINDLARAINSKRTRRVIRGIIRAVPFPFGR
jgi:hypothetical protein